MIRAAVPGDSEKITNIYNYYIANTVITFETDAIAPDEMGERISEVQEHNLPWLVAENESGLVVGYAYASKWKGRCAYRHSAEVTVYLAPDAAAQGVGTKLYEALFAELGSRGIHTAIGGIALPNQASVALHEKFGMKKVAHFAEVGHKFDRWIDVGYWQVVLNS